MSDITERPIQSTAIPDADALPITDSPRDEPYRPLSLLAIAGFSLAVLYAFLVLLGGLVPVLARYPRVFALLLCAGPLIGLQIVLLSKQRTLPRMLKALGIGLGLVLVVVGLYGLLAYAGTNPWLILDGPGWFLVMAAIACCWLASRIIQTSEGTLDGAWLASFGLTLSLISALIYGAYLASNTFAIRGQARQVAEQFLRLITEGTQESTEKAFLLMLPVRSRPSEAEGNLRRRIEMEFNLSQDPTGRTPGGPFSQFRATEYVKILQTGDLQLSFERVGISKFERGAYDVGLYYRAVGPLGTFLIHVATRGEEVTDATGTSRRWQITPQATRLEESKYNDFGNIVREGSGYANIAIVNWTRQAEAGNAKGAFLFTLPETDRIRFVGNLLSSEAGLPLLGGPSIAVLQRLNEASQKDFEEQLAAYRSGKLIDVDTYPFFVAPDDNTGKDVHRKAILDGLTRYYSGEPPLNVQVTTASNQFPRYSNKEPGVYYIPMSIKVPSPIPGKAGYTVEADLQVIGPPPDRAAKGVYRIGKLRLFRGQFTPTERLGEAP